MRKAFYDDADIRALMNKGWPPSAIEARRYALTVLKLLSERHQFDAAFAERLDAARLEAERTVRTVAGDIGAGEPGAAPTEKIGTGTARVRTLAGETVGTLDAFLKWLESEFDDVMDRVSGWYLRRAKVMLFRIGLVLAVGSNIDILRYADRMLTEGDSGARIDNVERLLESDALKARVERLGQLVPGWVPPPVSPRAVTAGRFVQVEPVTATHMPSLFAAKSESDAICDYLPCGPFRDIGAQQDWVCEEAAGEDPMFFALVEAGSRRALWVSSHQRIAPGAGSIEVGQINLSPALQGTRAATETMALMKGRAFALGYRRFEWKCNAPNLASRRAAERLGLSVEGVFRQAAVINGRNRDTAWFAATDEDRPRIEGGFAAWLADGNFDAAGRQPTGLSDLTREILVARKPALA